MRAVMNVSPSESSAVAPPWNRSYVSLPFVILTLIMAGVGVIGIYFTKLYLLAILLIPLLVCGILQPSALLILAFALLPFGISLTHGDSTSSTIAEICVSDILLLLALPGLLFQAIRRPSNLLLGKLIWPIGLYIGVGLLSFYLNIPKMTGSPLSYFFGFLRTAQIVLGLPLFFASISWQPQEIRNLVRGYLLGVTALAVIGLIAFIWGVRDGLYIWGMHKNEVGLNLCIGALIAIAALSQPHLPLLAQKNQRIPPEPLGISKGFLITVAILCVVALVCSLSRGSYLGLLVGLLYISIVRRRGRVFGLALLGGVLTLVVVMRFLPEETAAYVTDVSTQRRSNNTRLEQAALSLDEFRQNWVLGDGFRARRDFLPHNMEMMVLAENGLVGSLLFVWLLIAQARLFQRGRRTFLNDPLREGFCVVVVACSIGVLTQSQVDPFWRRGVLWIPWAGTGAIVAMMAQEKQCRLRERRRSMERELPVTPRPRTAMSPAPVSQATRENVPGC